MKNRIGVSTKIIVCIFLILSTTGCWNRRELDTLAILMGIGLDKPKESSEIELTAQIAKTAETKDPIKEGFGGIGNAYWNIKSTGDTVFNAMRGFTHESGRKIYLPHNQVIIFGKEMAEAGVQKYIDFFIRDPETRLNVLVLVSKGSASEVLDVKSELEKIPALNISNLIEGQAATSQTSSVKLKDFLTQLMSKTTAPVAPLIEVSGEGEKKTVLVSGTAVFKKDKLVGQLDKNETRGLLWAINKVKSGIIAVNCPDGDGKVSLEIIRAHGEISAEIKDNKIHVKVKIKEEGNIGDQECTENLALPPKVAALNKEKAKVIQGEVIAALKKARELKTDIFGFGEAVHQKYPKQWEDMEKRWDELFPDIEVEIIVETKLELTGQTTKPVVPE
ncbi:MAG: Ger(x)C family spore germination protein [Ruminiclostridium sp.]